jgi:hypothetical protein
MFKSAFQVSNLMFIYKICKNGWQREKREDLEAWRSGCNNGSILFFLPKQSEGSCRRRLSSKQRKTHLFVCELRRSCRVSLSACSA